MSRSFPIYFIHGFRGSSDNFLKLQKYFPQSTAVKLPGFGRNEDPNILYDLSFYLSFLKKQIKQRSILVGHSMGAYLAQEFAITYPELVEKVVVIGYPINKQIKQYKKTDRQNRIVLPYRSGWLTYLQELLKPFVASIIGALSTIVLPQNGHSIKDYLSTQNTLISSIWIHTVVPSDMTRLSKLKDKAVIINGDRDVYNYDAVQTFDKYGKSYILKGMSHQFFRYEEKIARIIQENIGS